MLIIYFYSFVDKGVQVLACSSFSVVPTLIRRILSSELLLRCFPSCMYILSRVFDNHCSMEIRILKFNYYIHILLVRYCIITSKCCGLALVHQNHYSDNI